MGDPDAEAVKDVWNPRVFGFSGTLDFSPLSQRWLRETAKQWALVMLPTPWAKGSRVGERIAALEVLSRSLASRPDGGVDHRVLGRADIVAFKNRVAHLAAAGTLTRHQHPRVIALVARFLRQAREEGLAREGSPMAGLPEDFVLGRNDRVPRPEATLIRSQQQRARLRYPLTPTDRLRLFPAPSKNPDGEKP